MAKKKFSSPFLILGGMSAGDDEVIGGGSAQSGQDPWLCDYNDWLLMYAADITEDNVEDEHDYYLWFVGQGGDENLWNTLNPGMPFQP